jgi:oligo-1,6-glucosidase
MRDTATPWWKDTTIYHIYPRSFRDTNGDGIGDLPGIIEKLPYLRDLGIGAIWMGPVFRSPQVDNGYDVSDYRDIDPLFGTIADMERLIDTAHRHGIRVLLDLVFNHSSDRHEWFRASVADPSGPYGDYYIWRDAPGDDGAPVRHDTPPGERPAHAEATRVAAAGRPAPASPLPNNWTGFFTGPTWTWSPERGQYYLHLFAPGQPELNWENPTLRREFAMIANEWLDRGVDGFRMDVINFISKKDGLSSVPPECRLLEDQMTRIIDEERTLRYLAELRARLHRADEILLVGETPHISPATARAYTDPGAKALDMVLLFEHMMVDHGAGGRSDPRPWQPLELMRTLATQQERMSDRVWPSLYMGNHDQPRIVSRFGDPASHRVASATALATLFYLQRGTPIVYQGDEIGMANFPFADPGQIQDIEGRNVYAELVEQAGLPPEEALRRVRAMARDNSRTPMQWTTENGAGFSTGGTPWFPVNPDHREWNVAAQAGTEDSILGYYRRLLRLRRENQALREGAFALVADAAESSVAIYRRWVAPEGNAPDGDLTAPEAHAPVGSAPAGHAMVPTTAEGRTSPIDREALILVNLSSHSAPIPSQPGDGLDGRPLLLANYPALDSPAVSPVDDLRPWEARVLGAIGDAPR